MSTQRDTGLRLHHVGYAVKSIAGPSAEYVQRFGYQEATKVIHDPHQTAFVQFLRLPGDATYLEFVAPDSPASLLSNAANKARGLNHLCYTSGALEEAIASLEQRGMRLISPPVPGVAFAGRRICWLIGTDPVPVELVERRHAADTCKPGT